MNRVTDGALIVFAREPRAGTVKTRLAAKIGAAAAAEVYAQLLSHALRLAEGSRFPELYLYAAESSQIAYFVNRLDPDRWRVRAQREGDLGRRMHGAIEQTLGEHAFAVLIGSDIADCTACDLDRAWLCLKQSDASAVIGPSVDGGYWLLGMREASAQLFENIPWSTAAVLAHTTARMTALGLEVLTLTPRHDIDEIGDLQFLSPA